MFDKIVRDLAEKAQKNSVTANNEYIGEDGLRYCGVCHKPKEQFLGISLYFPDGKAPFECDCDKAARLKMEEETKLRKAQEHLAELQRHCFTDTAYSRHTFGQDKGYNPEARRVAEWYVDTFEERRKKCEGLLFMGDTGTGKTFFACCIANALLRKGVAPWVTAVQPLLRDLGDFNRSSAALREIQSTQLLVLDDFGTNQNGARNLDLLFEVIDTRERSGLPLIITTNLSPADFNNPPSIELKRIYSRIKKMCLCCEKSPVIMDGEDIRELAARTAHKA